MNFTVSIDSTASSSRLHVAGDLDYATADELVDAASQLLAARPGGRDLHLDFSDLTFCDSAGLSALLLLHRRSAEAGVNMHLDHRPPHLNRILEITGLLEYLTTEHS
ncbi:STAS domain-containing protein [Mycobacterium sp. B14F4]|uniref:STAS domain-containing protein n=1 Tax=Mycobacterium sp. B14F4 TaxID=3153565 RepID=UPI00325F45D3